MTTGTTGAAGPGRGGRMSRQRKRMSRQRKRDAVLRLLRGEDLETVSRSLGVTAATLDADRLARCVPGRGRGESFDPPADGEALESGRLTARLGEMLLTQELLEAKIAALEARGAGPSGRRRSRP